MPATTAAPDTLHVMLPTAYWLHTGLEIAAYSLGFQLFRLQSKRHPRTPPLDRVQTLLLIAGAIAGAALGSKVAYWLYDPVYAFGDFPDPRRLLEGKSILGGLLGGLCGVEAAKRVAGISGSTGDRFVLPLTVGMVLGRIGCFLAGLDDHTYGNPTSLPWGVDFGDGVPRHPTQLYEILFLLAWSAWLHVRRARFAREGDRFRAYLAMYLLYRLCVESIRPIPVVYFGALSGLQLLCIAGLLYYARDIPRLAQALAPWRK